jgi:molecular chaperone GrpE
VTDASQDPAAPAPDEPPSNPASTPDSPAPQPKEPALDPAHEQGQAQSQARAEPDPGEPPARDLAGEVERLERQLEESFSRGQQTQARLAETHDRLLRSAAELENVKRRGAKEREDLRKFAVEALLKDFLPVGDNLERALDHAEQHDPKVVIEGVRLVQKIFEQALGKHGVVGFSAAGKMFDPAVHEALMQAESDLPPGTVVMEMARGYKLNDRLVRPAAVVVAKPKEPAAPGAGGSPAEGTGGSAGGGAVA